MPTLPSYASRYAADVPHVPRFPRCADCRQPATVERQSFDPATGIVDDVRFHCEVCHLRDIDGLAPLAAGSWLVWDGYAIACRSLTDAERAVAPVDQSSAARVPDCRRPAAFECEFVDRVPGWGDWCDRDTKCPFICAKHALANEPEGSHRESRYPFTKSHHYGWTRYRDLATGRIVKSLRAWLAKYRRPSTARKEER